MTGRDESVELDEHCPVDDSYEPRQHRRGHASARVADEQISRSARCGFPHRCCRSAKCPRRRTAACLQRPNWPVGRRSGRCKESRRFRCRESSIARFRCSVRARNSGDASRGTSVRLRPTAAASNRTRFRRKNRPRHSLPSGQLALLPIPGDGQPAVLGDELIGGQRAGFGQIARRRRFLIYDRLGKATALVRLLGELIEQVLPFAGLCRRVPASGFRSGPTG